MLIPLFYYLSNPFLHRMTNFIPTAAPIFPRSCSFPQQPGRLGAPLRPPPPLLSPASPAPAPEPAPGAPAAPGTKANDAKHPRENLRGPARRGERAAESQENKSHTSVIQFIFFWVFRNWRDLAETGGKQVSVCVPAGGSWQRQGSKPRAPGTGG